MAKIDKDLEKKLQEIHKASRYDPEQAKRYAAYRNTYAKENIKQISIRLNKTNHEDFMIIMHLEDVDNINKYIKDLILKDMEQK